MSLLFSREITSAILAELEQAQESVQIITAYCKLKAFMKLAQTVSSSVKKKRVMLRFRLEDILKGSTDFDILEYCMENDWEIHLRFDLHAKTYIVDNKRGIVGSANATGSGLGIGRTANYEMGTIVTIGDDDIQKIERMFSEAILVDDTLYNKLRAEYEKGDIESPKGEQNKFNWSKDITGMFRPSITTLFSYEFPESSNYMDYIDKSVLFLEMDDGWVKEDLKNALRWSNSYLWLTKILQENDGYIFFGGATEKLHSVLVSDPKPYRKDVKVLLSNLLCWIQDLEMEEIKIDRPRYSQRISLVE